MCKKYLEVFFEEKQLPNISWQLIGPNGVEHIIDSEYVIEAILNAPRHEQKKIADIIRKIDFQNGDVNHFLKHLAQGLVNNYDGALSD